jgi:hypothetical protein
VPMWQMGWKAAAIFGTRPLSLAALLLLALVAYGAAAYLDKHFVPRLDPHAADEAALQENVAAALPAGSTKAQKCSAKSSNISRAT